ncbi:MAG: hypothetical protein JO159_18750 [Acidobacteria bacterium]|nr:hypothetical protein [Acidobacteriota bacterium]MBV9624723.1 hypothetical protein [Acidobacteriota bacterium]
MAIVVVGGQSRSVGKTSVVAGIIAALRSYDWTAFKVTQFGHGRCSLHGQPCRCASDDHLWSISEEHDPKATTDSSRFLAAGARRSFWVRTRQGRLAEAMPALRKLLYDRDRRGNAIVESNSIVDYIQPDLYLTILDPATEDWKASALRLLERAEAIVLHQSDDASPGRIFLPPLPGRRIFPVRPPEYVTPDIICFLDERLREQAKLSS